MILHYFIISRFTKNNFFVEKNPSIVTFPGHIFNDVSIVVKLCLVKNLEMKFYLHEEDTNIPLKTSEEINRKLSKFYSIFLIKFRAFYT
jgi:hypothetical protein